jgi:hypothetical protein
MFIIIGRGTLSSRGIAYIRHHKCPPTSFNNSSISSRSFTLALFGVCWTYILFVVNRSSHEISLESNSNQFRFDTSDSPPRLYDHNIDLHTYGMDTSSYHIHPSNKLPFSWNQQHIFILFRQLFTFLHRTLIHLDIPIKSYDNWSSWSNVIYV